jgi:DNA recombination protein RmuC
VPVAVLYFEDYRLEVPMTASILVLLGFLAAALLLAVVLLLRRRSGADLDQTLRSFLASQDEFRRQHLDELARARGELQETLARQDRNSRDELGQLRKNVETGLTALGDTNQKKLDELRTTVAQQLGTTITTGFTQSFKLVQDGLAGIQGGLGEMRQLAGEVGSLKRIFNNVKARGVWGEVQLEALLADFLTEHQYEKNAQVRPGSRENVEFVIKLPGEGTDGAQVLLPIDSKLPVEDYQRLLDAHAANDTAGADAAAKALEKTIRSFAGDISSKYLAPPVTTDFAILYLPSEGLYAEVLHRPGLAQALQNQYRIIPAGPTTLAGLLGAIQLGFRSFAIQQKGAEVWQTLASVKTELDKFQAEVEKVEKKFTETANAFSSLGVRTRALQKRLKGVESLEEATPDPALPADHARPDGQ